MNPYSKRGDRYVALVLLFVGLIGLLALLSGCEYAGMGPQPGVQRGLRDYAVYNTQPTPAYEVWIRRVR